MSSNVTATLKFIPGVIPELGPITDEMREGFRLAKGWRSTTLKAEIDRAIRVAYMTGWEAKRPAEERVVLEMPREHAQVLRDLCRHVGGHPLTTRRGLVDGVAVALDAAEVFPTGRRDITGTMRFAE